MTNHAERAPGTAEIDWKAEYEALAVAAGNTADDADRYFLAWQSARRRAARLAAGSS